MLPYPYTGEWDWLQLDTAKFDGMVPCPPERGPVDEAAGEASCAKWEGPWPAGFTEIAYLWLAPSKAHGGALLPKHGWLEFAWSDFTLKKPPAHVLDVPKACPKAPPPGAIAGTPGDVTSLYRRPDGSARGGVRSDTV